MTAPTNKPLTQEQLDRFRSYLNKHLTWGSLHIVLDDTNVRDSDVQYCIQYAEEQGDVEGAALARILLSMSESQRMRLPSKL